MAWFRVLQIAARPCGRLVCFASQSNGSRPEFYKLLGISPNSSRAEIRAAYISMIKVMHPDVSTDEDATVDAIALNAAYTALVVRLHADSVLYITYICYGCQCTSCVFLL